MMTLRSKFVVTVAALSLFMGGAPLLAGETPPPPPPGPANPPGAAERIVGRTLEQFREIVANTCRDLERGSAEAVGRLVRLHRQGASDDDLRAAAAGAVARLTARAEAGLHALREARARGLTALEGAGGTAQQVGRINAAAANSAGAINACRERAAHRIAEALARLIG